MLVIGNEMRTALDHFISEARKIQVISPLGEAFQGDTQHAEASYKEMLHAETPHTGSYIQPFRWSFEDVHMDNLEVYRGDCTDDADDVDKMSDNADIGDMGEYAQMNCISDGLEGVEGIGRTVEAVGSERTERTVDQGRDSPCFSYSTVNRPVRVLIGRKEFV